MLKLLEDDFQLLNRKKNSQTNYANVSLDLSIPSLENHV